MKNKLYIFYTIIVVVIALSIWFFFLKDSKRFINIGDIPNLSLVAVNKTEISDAFIKNQKEWCNTYVNNSNTINNIHQLLNYKYSTASLTITQSGENIYVIKDVSHEGLTTITHTISLYYFDGKRLFPIFENLVELYDLPVVPLYNLNCFASPGVGISDFYSDGKGNIFFAYIDKTIPEPKTAIYLLNGHNIKGKIPLSVLPYFTYIDTYTTSNTDYLVFYQPGQSKSFNSVTKVYKIDY